MKWEYHQEAPPLEKVAEVCQRAAEDGWRLHTAMPIITQRSPLDPRPVPGAFLLFERATVNGNPANRLSVLGGG